MLTIRVVCAVLAVPFLLGSSRAVQSPTNPNWVPLAQSLAADFSYDGAHIERTKEGYLRVQFRLVYRTDTDEGKQASSHMTSMTTPAMEGQTVPPVAYGITAVLIDCKSNRFRQQQQAVFAQDGKLIEAVPNDLSKWDTPSTGTVFELLLKQVCKVA